MGAVRLSSYTMGVPVGDQLVQELVATRLEQNRWGRKFSRLWQKHFAAGVAEGVETIGTYDFTRGMQATVSQDYIADAEAAEAFALLLHEKLIVDVGSGWSIDGLLAHSFFAVSLSYTDPGEDAVSMAALPDVRMDNLQCCLSLEADSGDGRRVSWWHSDSGGEDTPTTLSPLLHEEPSLLLYSDDGQSYGHANGMRDGSSHLSVLGLYGAEDRTDPAWASDQDAKLSELWEDLKKYLLMMTKQQADRSSTGKSSLAVGLAQLLGWLSWRAAYLREIESDLSIAQGRVADDLTLLKHLEMEETLRDQITDTGDIERIYYTLEKSISPPTVTYPDGTEGPDTDYAWWEEEQFGDQTVTDDAGKVHTIPGIRTQIKHFEQYCVVRWAAPVQTGGEDAETVGQCTVTLRRDLLDKSGWKLYEFCRAWLDVEVEMEDPAWYETLFRLLLGAFQIYLTWISGLPTWLKALTITDIALSAMGIDIAELHLAVAAAGLGYSLYSTNWTGLSGRQMFEQAFNQIDMVARVYNSYEAIALRGSLAEEHAAAERRHMLAQVQDEAMRWLYTDAYSQYDTFYNMLYRWDPPSASVVG